MRYRVVIEQAGENYSAYVPDLPGCIATGATLETVRLAIAEAVDFHLVDLVAAGEKVPAPTAPQPEFDDPFVTFTEWAGEADETAYAYL